MCEFHDSNCNGFGDMWWTDKCTYFSSSIDRARITLILPLFNILYSYCNAVNVSVRFSVLLLMLSKVSFIQKHLHTEARNAFMHIF